MDSKKIISYLLYAIGEIVLVVIGILIAVQIYNWNDQRKEKNYLARVYSQIKQDLQTDTFNLRLTIKDLEEKNARLTDIAEGNIPMTYYDTLNEFNYKNCDKCKSDITNLEPFQHMDKGFILLKSLTTNQDFREDSLTNVINEFYSQSLFQVEQSQTVLKEFSVRTMENYKQYDWFVDWANFKDRPYNKAYVSYLFESEAHRKECAHYLIFSQWTLHVMKAYQEKSIQILKLLDKKLNKK